TCDTVFPIRGRRVDRAVHLGTRCDGQAHGGCQAGCLIFWKEAWLRPLDQRSRYVASADVEPTEDYAGGCGETTLWAAAQPQDGPVYVCQATRLPYATTSLAWWDVRQYLEDYRSGNVGLGAILTGAVYSAYYNLSQAGIGLGRPMRWLYNILRPLWRGTRFPR